MNQTREQIQQEGLLTALRHERGTLAISMGVGKTYIGLQYLQFLCQRLGYTRFLVAAPKRSIFQSWQEDAERFGIDPRVMQGLTFTTYLSLRKQDPERYEAVVLDEVHNLLPSHRPFLEQYAGRILGLTGTPPREGDFVSARKQLLLDFCPIRMRYITEQAVSDQILNDYRIIVHTLPLSQVKNLPVKVGKSDRVFYTSEQESYQFWSRRVISSTGKAKQVASVMRMKAMMDFPTKVQYAAQLLKGIRDKCLVFANTQEQAERLCTFSFHSKNKDSKGNLESFKRGEIQQLSCVMQLSEGVTVPGLREGIILHAYGNEKKSNQRIGRMLRLNPTETATVHILCYRDTVDEQWVASALADLDPDKISYRKLNPIFVPRHERANAQV